MWWRPTVAFFAFLAATAWVWPVAALAEAVAAPALAAGTRAAATAATPRAEVTMRWVLIVSPGIWGIRGWLDDALRRAVVPGTPGVASSHLLDAFVAVPRSHARRVDLA